MTILTVGIALLFTQLSQTHSAESSAVSRSYATLLIPVHSLCVHVCTCVHECVWMHV